MARCLKIRRPHLTELRKLDKLLCGDLSSQQARRANAILLYGEGLSGTDIAAALCTTPLTIYRDLRLFDKFGLTCLQPTKRGVCKRLTDEQEEEILRIANCSPIDLGKPFSHWSLSKLKAYLRKERIVAKISREHLRRVLKKGGFTLPTSNAKL